MLYVDSGQDLVVGGMAASQTAEAAYRTDKYHQPADEYDESWNFLGMVQDAAVLHRLGLDVANSTAWPNYRPTSEFRPIRDQSAARRR